MIRLMKGLEEYIKVHGRHFTEELASAVTCHRWSPGQIEKAAQRKVWYNVTGSTRGDLIYLVNEIYKNWQYKTLNKCLNYPLYVIGEHRFHGGAVFNDWLEDNKDFDFTPYI